jgi:lipopolysaccharide biosynthesis protein
VIEAFFQGIMAKWQFQDFCKENPRNNEEFRRVIEKMIMAEEKTTEIFSTEITKKTIETTRTGGIFRTSDIRTGSVDQTTQSPWLIR